MSTPSIDYTSRDFQSIKDSLLDYAKRAFPEWIPGSEGDFGVLMLELLSYIGDVNSYYVDRAQRESYLDTATQPESIRNIARILGYVPHNGQAATGTITLSNTGTTDLAVPFGVKVTTDFVPEVDGPIIFETTQNVTIPPGGTLNVPIAEGETKVDPVTGQAISIATGTGEIDQIYVLPHPGAYVDSITVYVAGDMWRQVTNLLDGDLREPVYEVRTDATGFTSIRFGDDINGRIPSAGLPITATYRVGVGARGNVPVTSIKSIYEATLPGLTINPALQTGETSGGSDAEPIEEIRSNAPRVFFSQQRAVTEKDFKNFALAVPGVTKANVLIDYWASVNVYILGPGGTIPTQRLRDEVQKSLQSVALAGVQATVNSANKIKIRVGESGAPVTVTVFENYVLSNVELQVRKAIERALSVAENEMGSTVSVSTIYRAIMSVEGVRYATIPRIARTDFPQTNADDIVLRPWEFPVLDTLNLTMLGGAN